MTTATTPASVYTATPRQLQFAILNMLNAQPNRWFYSWQLARNLGAKYNDKNAISRVSSACRALIRRELARNMGSAGKARWQAATQAAAPAPALAPAKQAEPQPQAAAPATQAENDQYADRRRKADLSFKVAEFIKGKGAWACGSRKGYVMVDADWQAQLIRDLVAAQKQLAELTR